MTLLRKAEATYWEQTCLLSDHVLQRMLWLRTMLTDLMHPSTLGIPAGMSTVLATEEGTPPSIPPRGHGASTQSATHTSTVGGVGSRGTDLGAASRGTVGGVGSSGTDAGVASTERTGATGGMQSIRTPADSSRTLNEESEWHLYLLERKLIDYTGIFEHLVDLVFNTFSLNSENIGVHHTTACTMNYFKFSSQQTMEIESKLSISQFNIESLTHFTFPFVDYPEKSSIW